VSESLRDRRVLITGAARGIGAATARRLHERGARVALAGLEPDQLAAVAAECGDAPWAECDVSDRSQVETAVELAVDRLGGLDAVMANAGIAAQLPMIGGDVEIFEKTIAVNALGVYYTLRTAGPHVAHPSGYALAVSSLGAAIHLPLMGAYSAAKAAVEAMANSLRIELRHTGARVGVAYFAELDTDMTSRGFGTRAAAKAFATRRLRRQPAPLSPAIDAIERGIARRSRRVASPRYVGPLLPIRMLAQRVVETAIPTDLSDVLDTARAEHAPLTTRQPD
jgi:NAD(P)-dependent dehydrogenase (short-subunit alcohol dehydrogenase family)